MTTIREEFSEAYSRPSVQQARVDVILREKAEIARANREKLRTAAFMRITCPAQRQRWRGL